MNLVQIRFIFRSRISGRTKEITEIREYETWHGCIQIDYTQHLSVFIKQHVRYLRITMADTFRQFPFPIQTFSRTHFFRIFFNFIYKRLHFLHASCRILCHSLTQLLHAEFHVMKIRDSFTQFLGKVGQHSFKLTKLHTYQIRRFRSYCFQCLRLRNEHAHTPVTFSIKIICLSFGSRYKTKYLAIYIHFMSLF